MVNTITHVRWSNLRTHLALKRRKLYDMVGMLKPGRSTYFLDRLSFGRPASSTSPAGIICCRSLQKVSMTAILEMTRWSHVCNGGMGASTNNAAEHVLSWSRLSEETDATVC